jgi:hypothetical protein
MEKARKISSFGTHSSGMPSTDMTRFNSNSIEMSTRGASIDFLPVWARDKPARSRFWAETWDGFKRDRSRRVSTRDMLGADGSVFDMDAVVQATATSPLSRRLKGRHLQMIAIGGSIGMEWLPCPAMEWVRVGRVLMQT